MAESILKLRVDSQEYESKIKRATSGLQALDTSLKKAGKSFSDVDKEQAEFIRELGKMDTVSKDARGKVNELSTAYTNLALQYKHMTEAERQSQPGQYLAKSLEQLKQRAIDARKELEELNNEIKSPGFKGMEVPAGNNSSITGMMQVFGGNLMAKGAEVGVSAMKNLAESMKDTVQRGVELSKSAEGIRLAFDRINRPDLLDKLKEATHGTVSELELMKQAVKFKDFNLNLDEMGTLLAFAQQKAKDTGQSVDYMVDSIVTGLGRQSLMILDNLGLSAAQIKEEMKKSGDMTKAVAAIIKKQMEDVGDYTETAGDRGAKAIADLENATLHLGDAFRSTFGYDGVDEMSNVMETRLIKDFTLLIQSVDALSSSLSSLGIDGNAALNALAHTAYGLLTGPLGILLPLTAKQFRTYAENDGTAGSGGHIIEKPVLTKPTPPKKKKTGSSKTEKTEEQLNDEKINKLTQEYIKATDDRRKAIEKEIEALQKRNEEIKKLTDIAQGKVAPEGSEDALKEQLKKLQFERGKLSDPIAIEIQDQAIKDVQDKIDALNGKKVTVELKTDTQTRGEKLEQSIRLALSKQNTDADIQTLRSLIETQIKNGIQGITIPTDSLLEKIIGDGADIPDEYWQKLVNQINDKLKELNIKPIQIDFSTGNVKKQAKEMTNDWKSAAQAIQSVGSAMTQIEDPAAKVVGTIAQAIATIALAYAQASANAAANPANAGWGWIAFAAAGLTTMLSSISAIHSATGYAQGGIVQGNSFSGDNILAPIDGGASGFAGLNAGEIVLNKAAQGNLASQLQGRDWGGMHIVGEIQGTKILLVANRTLKAQNKGELVYWKG